MMFSSNSLEREDNTVGAHLNSSPDFFEDLKEES